MLCGSVFGMDYNSDYDMFFKNKEEYNEIKVFVGDVLSNMIIQIIEVVVVEGIQVYVVFFLFGGYVFMVDLMVDFVFGEILWQFYVVVKFIVLICYVFIVLFVVQVDFVVFQKGMEVGEQFSVQDFIYQGYCVMVFVNDEEEVIEKIFEVFMLYYFVDVFMQGGVQVENGEVMKFNVVCDCELFIGQNFFSDELFVVQFLEMFGGVKV